ncbi:MAG: S9 family peptidase [Halobacteriales archaeon]|nr:S9 family peptidase [Halobacteriales archaeon]
MDVRPLPPTEAAVRRFVEEFWRSSHRELEAGCGELALDVDVDNERALAFYDSVGFEACRHALAAAGSTLPLEAAASSGPGSATLLRGARGRRAMEPVEAADYHDIVQVADPQVAPDGDSVAFVRKAPDDEESYEATVYTVPVDGGEPSQFTVAEGVDSSPRYSPSGDRLAFVSTRGADDDRPQLWVLPTGGGEARQVTNVAGGVGSIAWSPDGTRIAFTQRSTPGEREEGLDLDLEAGEEEPEAYEREPPDPRVIDRLVFRTGTNYFDDTHSHLYVVDLAEDEVERLSAGGPDDDAPVPSDGRREFETPEWGGEDELYYTVCREADPDDAARYDVEALDLGSGEVETVVGTSGWGADLAATADGRVAFPYTPEERTSIRQTELRVHDRSTGETHELTAELDRTLAFGAGIQWGPEEEQVYFATPDEGAVALRRAPWQGGTVETVIHEGGLTGFSVGEDATAFVQSEWDHRGDVFLANDGGSTRLTGVNAEYLEAHAIGEPEELRFAGGDGDEVQGWVLTPPDFDPEETYPLAVEVHGGPHAMWTTSGTMWHEFQTLAARGYVVFWCNPRGSTGYGEAFMSAIERDWGDVTMADVMAGVDRVCERDYVDADDLHLTGGSFGGFMTGWMVGRTDRFTSAVPQRGVYDQLGFYGSTDWAYKLVEGDYDTTPTEEPLFLWEESPVAHADGVTTPTLVIHADRDFRVPVNNAELFHRLLEKHGVDTRLVRYPREGHELSRSGEPGHVVDRLERIARWFDGYSAHHDAPRALDRGDDGLSASEE